MLKATVAIIVALAAAGCVTTKAANLDDRTTMVSVKGTWRDSPADVYKAALVKAATIAQERGAACFHVVGQQDGSDMVISQTPTTYVNTGGGVLVAIPGRAGTTTAPRLDLTIQFPGSCEERPGMWQTRSVLAQTK